MMYELINLSDPITFEAPDLEIAALVTIVLGHGQYCSKPEEEGAEEVPFFMFGGLDDWWAKHLGTIDRHTTVKRRRAEVCASLRSVVCGDFETRILFDEAVEAITEPERRARFIASWNDRRRTSLNDIMGRAHELADALEAQAA